MSLTGKSGRELIRRLVLAEILARPGEGPLARLRPLRPPPPPPAKERSEPREGKAP